METYATNTHNDHTQPNGLGSSDEDAAGTTGDPTHTYADVLDDHTRLDGLGFSDDDSAESTADPMRFLVGGITTTDKQPFFVASPNCNYLPPFPRTLNHMVRLREDHNFALDNPILYPQPFKLSPGHLAAIPKPSGPLIMPAQRILYVPPNSKGMSSFVDQISDVLGVCCTELGAFEAVISELRKEIEKADEIYSEQHPVGTHRPSRDSFVQDYTIQMNFLLGHLQLPLMLKDWPFVILFLQRTCLELKGRLLWLSTYQSWCMNPPETPPAVVDSVIGGLVLDKEDLRRLCSAGLPVWFVQMVTTGKKSTPFPYAVKKSCVVQDGDALKTVNLGPDICISFRDENLPWDTVWQGSFTEVEQHYKFISRWLQYQLRPIGIGKPTSVLPVALNVPTSLSFSPSPGPSSSTRNSFRSQPCKLAVLFQRSAKA